MRSTRALLRTIVALELVLLMLLSGVAQAKYIKDQKVNGQIHVKADLGAIEIREHRAEKQGNGQYILTDEEVSKNVYDTLIPGLDIPKDPFVRLVGKTAVPAYVFVEVKTNLPADQTIITYELADCWMKTAITGKNGGTVYVLTLDGTNPLTVTNENDPVQIPVLETLTTSHLDAAVTDNGMVYYNAVDKRFAKVGLEWYEVYAAPGVEWEDVSVTRTCSETGHLHSMGCYEITNGTWGDRANDQTTIRVSQELKQLNISKVEIAFYASMAEIATGSIEKAYKEANNIT